jgi:hypothetical protein
VTGSLCNLRMVKLLSVQSPSTSLSATRSDCSKYNLMNANLLSSSFFVVIIMQLAVAVLNVIQNVISGVNIAKPDLLF